MLWSAGVTVSRLALGRLANLCTLACTSHELITRYTLVFNMIIWMVAVLSQCRYAVWNRYCSSSILVDGAYACPFQVRLDLLVELGRIMKYHSIPLGQEKLWRRIEAGSPAPSANHVLRASFRSMFLEVYCLEDYKFAKKRVLIARICVRRWLGLGWRCW